MHGLAQIANSAYDGGMDSYKFVIASVAQSSPDAAAISLALLPAPLLGLLLRQART
jgi:hypothetical protein